MTKRINNKIILITFLIVGSLFLNVSKVRAIFSEKFSNTTFDSNLTGWSGSQDYVLDDEFTDTVSAGGVNGGSSAPGPGVRTVTDTNNKVSVSSGLLNFATGTAVNDGIWLNSVSRQNGLALCGSITPSQTNLAFNFGYGVTQSGDPGGGAMRFTTSGDVRSYDGGTLGPAAFSYSSATEYPTCVVLRSTGSFDFMKFSGIWKLIGFGSTNASSTVYPMMNISTANAAFTNDYFRLPSTTFIPTPLAYDTFTRSNGAIGSTETVGPDSQSLTGLSWTGSTWTVSGNSALNTPTLGSELFVNTGFSADTNWTKGAGWTISGGVAVASSVAAGVGIQQTGLFTTGNWYQQTFDIVTVTANGFSPWNGSNFTNITAATTTGSKIWTFRAAGTGGPGIFGRAGATSGTVDNASLKQLTLSSLFSSVSSSTPSVITDANVTMTSGTQAGLVTNLDSTSNPQNFLIVYHDGVNVHLDKNVAGTYTSLINSAATYSAGANLRVSTDNSTGSLKVRVYYNGALIGSEQTVSDAGIIGNTLHGLFSTYSANTFDNYNLWARGTSGEYSAIISDDLTVTRETVITHVSSAGSAKLVAGANDANFYQSINLGNTNTYNISAYAYTDGSAVTSSDLALESGGYAITTTYTAIGGGWYQLTGTITGSSSLVSYGVRVKSGKTVYVDDLSLNDDEEGSSSSTSTICTDTAPSAAPTIFGASSGLTYIQIRFTPAGDPVSSYALEYGTKSGQYEYSVSNIGGKYVNSYTINGLSQGTAYYIRIRGVNGCASGSWSYTIKKATTGSPVIEVSNFSSANTPLPTTLRIIAPGSESDITLTPLINDFFESPFLTDQTILVSVVKQIENILAFRNSLLVSFVNFLVDLATNFVKR